MYGEDEEVGLKTCTEKKKESALKHRRRRSSCSQENLQVAALMAAILFSVDS